ncbi:uncharacterized protein RCC_09466 [Ramularia collo-cygni]|uniref:Uncharacterized protein n=1 Tax=Ramularia collo-cygni TaxID=112498 RepID=A0A2D3VF56_9PEZI|nr:uncharacterized protein RCC_09466 [Ramularia collo-cygni]CZT23752.1 uncharacterized protein RCC_09466 [Ramularia collo-cygni]
MCGSLVCGERGAVLRVLVFAAHSSTIAGGACKLRLHVYFPRWTRRLEFMKERWIRDGISVPGYWEAFLSATSIPDHQDYSNAVSMTDYEPSILQSD